MTGCDFPKAPKNGCKVFATVAATAVGSFGYKDTAAWVIASAISSQQISRVTSSGDLLTDPGIGLTKLETGVYGVKSFGTGGGHACRGMYVGCGCNPGGEIP